MNRLRERRRLDTVRAIKEIAARQLDEAGPAGLTLRGIARELGVAVQSLHHYFEHRDALLDALIDDSFQELESAVTAAVVASQRNPPGRRRAIAAHAVREWAHANRARFLLLSSKPQAMRPEDRRPRLVPIAAALAEIESVDPPSAIDADTAGAESYCKIHGMILMELLSCIILHPLPDDLLPNRTRTETIEIVAPTAQSPTSR